jgi:tetratricopeptide (TPR) repeat protein
MSKPLCFVLMPFGKKPDATGNTVDFDQVYQQIIKPAIENAGLECLRADEEMTGGIIHKPMFERLILCEYAVADLTTANANVFYELGLRHAVRPWSTVLIFADGERLPFDVGLLRAMPYKLSGGLPSNTKSDENSLTEKLKEAIKAADENVDSFTDSPIFQLVENFPDIQHLKTDVFRDRVNYSNEIKELLAVARRTGLSDVHEVEANLKDLKNLESAAFIDLFLSYRAVKGWQEMIDLAAKMPKPLAATVLVQEQLALALNRAGRGDEAEAVLQRLLSKRGASSETLGILGRVYKDRWEQEAKAGNKIAARGYLEKAIETYLKGFEADFRDAYPGINAVTLMELKEPPDARREKVLPIVRYAVEQRVSKGTPDYWDYATLLELAVLAKDEAQAMDYIAKALSEVREVWQPETTLRNLRLIREAREKRSENTDWIKEIEEALLESTKA